MYKLGFFARLQYWLSPTSRRAIQRERQREEYQSMMFLKGKNLWDEINKELPQAHGVIEDDIPRMEAFNKLKETFLPKEKQALRIFLNREIYEWDHNFCEITSGLQEQYERRQLQIYRQHLAALNGSEWP